MRVFRSAAMMMYDTGPTADPRIMPAVMSSIVDVEYRVQCLLPEKKSTSRLNKIRTLDSTYGFNNVVLRLCQRQVQFAVEHNYAAYRLARTFITTSLPVAIGTF